jgi:L-fucose isomerase-like protein
MKTKVGFIVFGVHKDGLEDPMGVPFIDDAIVEDAAAALEGAGVELVRYKTVLATKQEARKCMAEFKCMDDVDVIVLFSGTWVWAAHLTGALRDFAGSGKGVVLWTVPGSQGWRPVGGFVMHGALKEIGLAHKYVYGHYDDTAEIDAIVAYCHGSALKNLLNMSTIGTFGGRGMGQACGVADPSQWMKQFGIDIDSRDTSSLLERANSIDAGQIAETRESIQHLFADTIPVGSVADKSIALYLATKQLVGELGWDFYTIQSFPGIADDFSATCFSQSMMLEDGVGTSTLGDFNTALTVKCLTELSDDPIYYGDLQHIDKSNNEIKIIGDGACPPSLAGKIGPAGFAEHGIPTEGEAGGLSIRLVCKVGEGVLARLGRNDGKFEMVIVRCSIFEPDESQIESRKDECGIPFWPHGFVTAHCDIEELLQAWNNEYACLGYGEHLYDALIAFCEQTGIRPIAL